MFRPVTVGRLVNLDAVKPIEAQSNSIEQYLGSVIVVPSPAELDSTATLHELQSRMLTQLSAPARRMAWIPDPFEGGKPSELWQLRSLFYFRVARISISFYNYQRWQQQRDGLAVVAGDYDGGGPWRLAIQHEQISNCFALSPHAHNGTKTGDHWQGVKDWN
jgi:hypothetical protein